MPENTEAEVVERLTRQGVPSTRLEAHEPGAIGTILTPVGYTRESVDLERYLEEPRRTRGTVVLQDQASFAHFVREHADDPATHLYADRKKFLFTAVLNDAGVKLVEGKASDLVVRGWGDHRATLQLDHTKEWQHWVKQNNQLMDQETFSQHIEDGINDIIEPDAADILEMATTFRINRDVQFASAHTLRSGVNQFTYVENENATAGRTREIEIPTTFLLHIAPFEGSQEYDLEARFRYRMQGGHLLLGYLLTRPWEMERTAFEDTGKFVADDTGLYLHLGEAPAARQ